MNCFRKVGSYFFFNINIWKSWKMLRYLEEIEKYIKLFPTDLSLKQ